MITEQRTPFRCQHTVNRIDFRSLNQYFLPCIP